MVAVEAPHRPPGPPAPWSARWVRRTVRRRAVAARDAVALRGERRYRELAADLRLPDGSRRIYLHHLRKTAGTSLTLSFLALGGEDPVEVWRRITPARLGRTVSGPYPFVFNHRGALAEGAYLFGRAHLPAAAVRLPPRTFTITVLRDPVRRVHSFYDYLVQGDDPDWPGPVPEYQRRWAVDGFDAFLDRVPRRHLLTQLATFSPGYDPDEAARAVGACSAVFLTERFADGLADLATRLDLPLVVHRARVTPARSTLTGAQVDRLRELLAPEYRLLGRLAEAGVVPAPAGS
jgi:hypothetical protein